MKPPSATLALILAMALWGSSFPAFKYALAHFDGWFVIWARLVVASLLTLCLLPFASRFRLARRDAPWLALMGLCEPCLYFIFETHALRLTSAAEAGIVVALLPLLVTVAAGIFLGERITARFLLGMLLGLVGVGAISLLSTPSAQSPAPLLGNLLELAAMVCATGYIIAVKRLSAYHSAFALVAVQNGIGVIFFLPFVLLGGDLRAAFEGTAPPAAWGLILYLGTAVSLLAFYLYNTGLRHIPASQAVVFGNLIPIFAVLLSVGFLGESLSLAQAGAAALILFGLLLTQTGNRPTAARS